jgi:hypothetical protein
MMLHILASTPPAHEDTHRGNGSQIHVGLEGPHLAPVDFPYREPLLNQVLPLHLKVTAVCLPIKPMVPHPKELPHAVIREKPIHAIRPQSLLESVGDVVVVKPEVNYRFLIVRPLILLCPIQQSVRRYPTSCPLSMHEHMATP